MGRLSYRLHCFLRYTERRHFPKSLLDDGWTNRPRRLRLAIEHLANERGCSYYFVDLDPHWVKRLAAGKQFDQAEPTWIML